VASVKDGGIWYFNDVSSIESGGSYKLMEIGYGADS
jgi:hypothetical protein